MYLSLLKCRNSTSTMVISPHAIFYGNLTISGQTSATAESLLSEKISLAQQLLNKGHIPEVEILRDPNPPKNNIVSISQARRVTLSGFRVLH